tara:strand:+ start:968 stop:1168 length:201 start_codon:yes stop_codon:yes gene_type:complete
MNNEEYKKFYIEATKVLEVIEDTVSHVCDENRLSGEKVWHMIAAMSMLKCQEFDTPDSTFDINHTF